eukprot:TRINITY_DN48287_c0_g1_i1.p2 TRINITY_DN48287_c0_g1~~TRINITY_DN48287_c0_g1_i1.p2  ORF type:complete len:125 (-),score=22.50 TRINITY_DN48287_c0_g1_i1:248-622(-)
MSARAVRAVVRTGAAGPRRSLFRASAPRLAGEFWSAFNHHEVPESYFSKNPIKYLSPLWWQHHAFYRGHPEYAMAVFHFLIVVIVMHLGFNSFKVDPNLQREHHDASAFQGDREKLQQVIRTTV